ncbi:unnamed protein product [Staurois parvus]|uniref:Uncharacterized protein n=1 Tax=Staurois parvus TaxID=386267 RepID=A0ABN9EUJ8_9NEOB|nr:unnamed protein product [Staurois parvus]
MRDSGPGSSSMRRRVQGPMADYGPGSSNGRPVICQHPMTKNGTHQQCVRRPESGTWQSVAEQWETAAMGAPLARSM